MGCRLCRHMINDCSYHPVPEDVAGGKDTICTDLILITVDNKGLRIQQFHYFYRGQVQIGAVIKRIGPLYQHHILPLRDLPEGGRDLLRKLQISAPKRLNKYILGHRYRTEIIQRVIKTQRLLHQNGILILRYPIA